MFRYFAHAGHDHDEETGHAPDETPGEATQTVSTQSQESAMAVDTATTHAEFSPLPFVIGGAIVIVVGLALFAVLLQKATKK